MHLDMCTDVLLFFTRPVILSAYTDSDIYSFHQGGVKFTTNSLRGFTGVRLWANKTQLMEGEARNTGGRSDEPESHPSQTQNWASSNHIRHTGWCMSREVTDPSSYTQHSSPQEVCAAIRTKTTGETQVTEMNSTDRLFRPGPLLNSGWNQLFDLVRFDVTRNATHIHTAYCNTNKLFLFIF